MDDGERYYSREYDYVDQETSYSRNTYTDAFVVEEHDNSLVGKAVLHATYGEGLIKSIEGKGEKAKVTVHFRRYGLKKLIWGYANLTVM
jgi:DNA helicase-2/ATP-dependent DNA helicase PcrA